MKVIHQLNQTDVNLENSILNHSADKCIAYKYISGEPIYLGYYFPKNYDSKKQYPTFLFIHGGGWESHTIFPDQSQWHGDHLGYLARYYANKGFVCVSIDYRLARNHGQEPNYGILECYEDCCDAIDYVIEHSDTYGTDTSSMYLLGESAGGYLAGAVATFSYDRKYSFKKVFLINPITDMNDSKWGKMVPEQSEHEKLAGLSFDECVRFLSPLYQISERNNNVVLIHGEADEFVGLDNSISFYEKVRSLSQNCELHIIEKTNHAFLLAEYYEYGLEACMMTIDIITSHVCERKLGFSTVFNTNNLSWKNGEKPDGFSYVELVAGLQDREDDSVRERALQRYMEDLEFAKRDNLSIWSIHLPYGDDLDLTVDESKSDEVFRNFVWYVDRTSFINPRYYVVHPSREPIDAKDREILLANANKNIKRLADYISKKGAVLAVESLPRTCLGNVASECIQLIANTKAVLCFDVNHMLIQSHRNFLEEAHKYVKTVHLSDYDFVDEKHWVPGDGSLNWNELVNLLDEYGYEGPMMFEVKSGKTRKQISLAELKDDFYKAIRGGELSC